MEQSTRISDSSYTLQQNGPVENTISRASKAGLVVRLEAPPPYTLIFDLRTSLRLETLLWASKCFTRSTTSGNDEWFYPHKVFYRSRSSVRCFPSPGLTHVISLMRRRGGLCIRATTYDNSRTHHGSLQFGLS